MTTTNTNIAAAAAAILGAPAEGEQEALLAVLRADLKKKFDACRRLGLIGDREAIPTLAALLGDEKLAHMARYALEPIPEGAVDEALRDALGRVKGRQLVGVIGSIGARRDAAAVGALAPFLGDGDPEVAATAARSLGKIGTDQAAGALKEKLGIQPLVVRLAVADGCLGCAEKALAAGRKAEATALYGAVAKADLPKYIRAAAEAAAAK